MKRLITYNSETHTLSEWAALLKISLSGLHYRLASMPINEAFTKPLKIQNIIYPPGYRFGKLTVIDELPKDKFYNRRILVECDCGKRQRINLTRLVNKQKTSCGCDKPARCTRKRKEILPDQKFGKLTVIKEIQQSEFQSNKLRRFQCMCDCGHFDTVRIDYLNSGIKQSCVDCENRNIKFVTMPDGTTQRLSNLAKTYNIGYTTLRARIKSGWPIEKALCTPVK